MRPSKHKQPLVKKGLCRVLEYVDEDNEVVRKNYRVVFLECLNCRIE